MPDQSNQIKTLIANLQKVINTVGRQSNDQIAINRELNKVITLLSSGFAQNEQQAKDLISEVENGLKITDEFASDWAKKRNIAKKDLDQVILKFHQIDQLNRDIKKTGKEYNDLLDDRIDKIESEFDLSERLFESYDKIHEAVKLSKKTAQSLGSATEDIIDRIIDKRVPAMIKSGVLTDMFSDMFDSMTMADGLMQQIQTDAENLVNSLSGTGVNIPMAFDLKTGALDEEVSRVREFVELENQARLAGLVKFFNENEELQRKLIRKMAAELPDSTIKFDIDTGELMEANETLIRGTARYSMALKQLDNIALDKNFASDLSSTFLGIFELVSLGLDRTEDQNAVLKDMLSTLDKSSQFLAQAVIDRQDELNTIKMSLEYERDRLKLMDKFGIHMQIAENAVNQIGRGFDYVNSILPAGLGDLLGLQRVSFTLIDSHRAGVKSFFEEISKGEPASKAIRSYLGSFGPSLKLALNPAVLLVATFGILFKIASDITAKYKDMAQNMKTSVFQAKQLLDAQLDILTSQKNQFATMEDIQGAQIGLMGETGKVFDLTNAKIKDITVSLVETGKAFGYGVEQAGKLQRTFERLGANPELALNLQQNMGLMAEMAGLSPQIISNDLIESAEEVSTYFAGLPVNAAKAAIQIRKMGLSLKQAGQIAQNMLNLEGFMTDMYELQAMSAGGVDFSRAFDLGLMGDIEGMTEEIMNNIGSVAEFNQMDYLTRIKIAKTLGMSVDELAQSVKLREDMIGLGSEEQSYLKANLDRMGDISSMSQDQIRSRMKELQSTDRLGVAWDKIKGTLLKALLPAVEILADGIDAISPILDGLVQIMKVFGGILKIIFPIVKGLLFPFKIIGSVLEKITSTTDGILGKFSGFSGILDGIGSVLYAIGGVIGSIFVVSKIGSFFSFITTGFGYILKLVTGFIPTIKGFVTGIFDFLIGSTTKTTTAVSTSIQSINGAATASMQQTTEAAAVAMNQMNSVATNATNKIKGSAASTASSVLGQVDVISKKTTDSVKTNAELASKSITKLQTTGSKGIFGKKALAAVGTIGATALATLATQAAGTFFKMEKDGEESMSAMSASVVPIFGAVLPLLGPMLYESLYQGVEKFLRKKLEKKFEDNFTGSIDKISGKLTKVGDPVTESIASASEKSKGILGRTFDKVKDVISKPFKRIKTETISETINEDVLKKRSEMIEPTSKPIAAVKPKETIAPPVPKKIEPIDTKSLDSEVVKTKKSVSDRITSIGDTVSKVWNGIKSGITDVVKFGIDIVKRIATGIVDVVKIIMKGLNSVATELSGILKKISGAIGESIKNILKGIGEGLSKFKPTALIGASSLLVLSGALWVTSKAIQNFTSVSWEDLAKAGVTIAGLALAGTVLGSASPAMLLGAAAVAALGLALIPTSIALEKFNDIDWSLLGKAGVAMVGLGVIASGLGILAPAIMMGTVAMGTASVVIFGFADSIQYLSVAIGSLDTRPLKIMMKDLMQLSQIPIGDILAVSGTITALGASLLAFSTMKLGSSVANFFSNLIGSDAIDDLERLSNIANPLMIVSDAIGSLSDGLEVLSSVIGQLDLSQIDKIKEIGKISIEKRTVDQLQDSPTRTPAASEKSAPFIPITPFEFPQIIVEQPRKESVAQDVRIVEVKPQMPTNGVRSIVARPMTRPIDTMDVESSDDFDIYNRPELATKKLELLLIEANKLLAIIANKKADVNMDSYKVGKMVKARFND